MNTLQSFSLSTNLPISSPYLQRDYFPITLDLSKVILILNTFEDPNKQARIYDFFQDVIDFGYQELAKHGYSFFQPLTGKEIRLNCDNSIFNLTPNQIAYLIDNCALVIGNDNVYSYVANNANIKNITLFGPSSPCAHSPQFSLSKSISIRECEGNPSYRSIEIPKSINENKVETVLNNIYSLLEIECKSNILSIFSGQNYPLNVIQYIPDCIINPENFKNSLVTIRMDYYHNEDTLFKILESRKCNIICDKQIDTNKLKYFKENILQITYNINKNVDINYIKKLIKTGIRICFISEESGDDLVETRIKMFDYSLVENLLKQKIKTEISQKCSSKTFYRTNNFILSDGKIYTSHKKYLNKQSIPSFAQNTEKFDVNDHSIWENLDFIKIFDLT
jgi:hypothetical protein